MVRDPVEPQVVSQPGGVADHGGYDGDLGLAFPAPSVNLADIRRKYHSAVKEEKDDRKKA